MRSKTWDNSEAMLAYFGAMDAAQAQGRWLSDTTTAPGLRDAVKHATRFVAAGRRELFDAIIQPLRERYGRSELFRVDPAERAGLRDGLADDEISRHACASAHMTVVRRTISGSNLRAVAPRRR
ncbi:MAG: hypothetical protein ABI767_13125 [Rhodanobacter sp.]